MPEDEEIEILDVENYQSEKNQEFSHQALVMAAMKKVLEYGCQEMIEGYYSTEVNEKSGKTKILYRQDTRKAFIESVKTLRMVMICDFDDEAGKKLLPNKEQEKDKLPESLITRLNVRKQHWIGEEDKAWNSISDGQQKQLKEKGMGHMEGYFNMQLPYYQQYFLEELEIYREIFEELTKLTKRLKFYARERAEG